MAGHSKWANIKHKKAIEDAKRGKLFTKLAKDITIAAKQGGGDVGTNPTLRTAVEKAKANNMPKAKIERAIAKGTGELGGVKYEQVTYEGYGPKGVAFMIECMTDNKNRTVSAIRSVFNKYGGSLGDPGSVAYIFGGNPSTNEPSFKVPLETDEDVETFNKILNELEENDDIVNIYHNADISI